MSHSTIKTSKSGDNIEVTYRGVPSSALLPYRVAMLGALVCFGLQNAQTKPEDSNLVMVFSAAAGVLGVIALLGYAIYGLFAGFSGKVTFNPKEKTTTFASKFFGIPIAAGKIPWEDKLNVDLEQMGLKVKALPLSCYKMKIVTQFMTYHIATFGPKQTELAKEFAKTMVRARKGLMPKGSEVSA